MHTLVNILAVIGAGTVIFVVVALALFIRQITEKGWNN